jgi:hypothetical protein
LTSSERAHRLAIAAASRSHDRLRIAAARRGALMMLDELGATPEPATEILLRQEEGRSIGVAEPGARRFAAPPTGRS